MLPYLAAAMRAKLLISARSRKPTIVRLSTRRDLSWLLGALPVTHGRGRRLK